MKLYYTPGACSMASHIVLEEGGLKYSAESVNLKDKRTASGADYLSINPKGYVPCVALDSGELIGENSALLPYLGEQIGAKLMPPAGSIANYRVREWVSFVSSELHKYSSPLFRPDTPEATRQLSREMLAKRFAYIEKELGDKPYITGEQFTPADAYLFTVLGWMGHLNVDLSAYPKIQAFQARVAARPAVQKVMRDEGLIKAA